MVREGYFHASIDVHLVFFDGDDRSCIGDGELDVHGGGFPFLVRDGDFQGACISEGCAWLDFLLIHLEGEGAVRRLVVCPRNDGFCAKQELVAFSGDGLSLGDIHLWLEDGDFRSSVVDEEGDGG